MDKLLKFFSIIFIVIGILLILVGYYLKVMSWPDMFSGVISGSFTLILGVLLLALRIIIYRKKH